MLWYHNFLKTWETNEGTQKSFPNSWVQCHHKQKGVLQNVILKLLFLYLKSEYITVIKLFHDFIEIL